MAQPVSLDKNLPDLGGPFLYQDQDGEKASYRLETPYGFLLDLDFLKYVDDIERGQTLRKVARSRKAKGAKLGPASPREPAGGWTSTESLSSVASDDGKVPFSPRAKAWWSGSGEAKQPSAPLSPSPVFQLLPPPASKSLLRNTRVEKTLLETSKRLEKEQVTLGTGGMSLFSTVSAGPSETTGTSVPAPGPILEEANMPGKTSLSNSGHSTPAAALTPAHLQHVREQMAAALKQLKGLEEQVKVIPVLEETICRLTKEKEELVAGRRETADAGDNEAHVFCFPPKSPGAGIRMEEGCQGGGDNGASAKTRPSKIAGLKKLTEKLSSVEKGGKAGRGPPGPRKAGEPTCCSVGVGEDVDMKEAVFYYRCQKPCREVGVGGATETREASVWVMESLLGVSSEAEAEMALLRETVQHQKAVIAVLEQHLKEAADEMEELRLEVCARIPKELTSRETLARPETVDVSTEAVPPTRSQAVGSCVETSDVAVHCSPHVTCVGVCCDLPRDGCRSLSGRDKAVQVDVEGESEASKGESEAGPAQEASRWEETDTGTASGSSEEDLLCEPVVCKEVPRSELEAPLLTQMEEGDGASPQPEAGKRPPQRTGAGGLKSIMKKQDSPAKGKSGGGGLKVLKFVGVLNGEYESTSSEEEEEKEEGSPEKGSPLSSDSEGSGDTSVEDLGADLEGSETDPEGSSPGVAEGDKQPAHNLEVAQGGRESPKTVAVEGVKEKFELDPRMREACFILKGHLSHGGGASNGKEVLSSTSFVLQEWFRLSSQKKSLAGEVADHLQAFAEISPALLAHVVNLSDGNGNTALHYSVSHSNFDIVQLLLDTGVCNVNHQNKAGYTVLMLAALAAVEQEEEMAVVRRLFSMGNVNAKASQAGQTALMLAVSHGRQEMVEALLACGADINLQDEEGSNALMCACEHGRAGTVRLLLSQPSCDASIVDNDGNDAVSIALEAGHHDIAALISTHLTQSGDGPPDENRRPSSKKPL